MEMEKKDVVVIAGSEINAYSQIIRAAMSGSNACARLHDMEHMNEFVKLMEWAQDMHRLTVTRSCCK